MILFTGASLKQTRNMGRENLPGSLSAPNVVKIAGQLSGTLGKNLKAIGILGNAFTIFVRVAD